MKNIQFLITLFVITLIVGCTFEIVEDPKPIQEEDDLVTTTRFDGISDSTRNSIPVDAGEIGIAIDARQLATLGYKTSYANMTIIGELSSLSENNISFDALTNVALFKMSRNDLSADQLYIFSEGVAIKVEVFDDNNELVETLSNTKFIINGLNRSIKINTKKPKVLKELKFNPNVPNYLAVDGYNESRFISASHGSGSQYFNEESGTFNLNSTIYNSSPQGIDHQLQQFYFIELEEGIYAIKTAYKQSYLERNGVWLKFNTNNTDDNPDFTIDDRHKFILEQTPEGKVKILPYIDGRLSLLNNRVIPSLSVVSANIKWDFDDLGVEYSAAILPPAEMDFAFDQTIHNCSNATGQYYVGTNRQETTTTTIGIEESAELYSSTTDSKEATVHAEAGGTFFGVGASVSASGTIGTSSTRSFGSEKGSSKTNSSTVSETVSSNRKITVPPYTSVEVFDVIQKLENVRIPFVHRVLLRGNDDEGLPLSGPEIQTQLGASQFGGVIIEVGSDYVEYSIRGNVNISNYFQYKNSVNDIKGICDN